MNAAIDNGVWVTMVTPFTNQGTIDYPALEELIEWYIRKQAAGLFAVCKSSEAFDLTLSERLELAGFIVRRSAGRIPVIASGNLESGLERQIEEIKRVAETGVDAVVLISSTTADQQESDAVWLERVDYIIDRIDPAVRLGIYESPYPYKRIVSPEILQHCNGSGRFDFLKDTCCDLELILRKLEAVRGTRLKIFNAHTATLLDSLHAGCAGYSSIMSNIIPELYVWLVDNYQTQPARAKELSSYLVWADDVVTRRCYPLTAKYYLSLEGLPFTQYTRTKIRGRFDEATAAQIEDLHRKNQQILREYGVIDHGGSEES